MHIIQHCKWHYLQPWLISANVFLVIIADLLLKSPCRVGMAYCLGAIVCLIASERTSKGLSVSRLKILKMYTVAKFYSKIIKWHSACRFPERCNLLIVPCMLFSPGLVAALFVPLTVFDKKMQIWLYTGFACLVPPKKKKRLRHAACAASPHYFCPLVKHIRWYNILICGGSSAAAKQYGCGGWHFALTW